MKCGGPARYATCLTLRLTFLSYNHSNEKTMKLQASFYSLLVCGFAFLAGQANAATNRLRFGNRLISASRGRPRN